MDGLADKDIPKYRLSEMGFRVYSNNEIKALSVKEISYPISFNSLAHANNNGLYDSSLGPHAMGEVCSTCGQNNMHCPGHMGHIQLTLPVYHPLFFKQMYKLLKATCFDCHRLTVNVVEACLFVGQIQLLEKGYVTSFLELSEQVFSLLKDRDMNSLCVLVEIKDFISSFILKTINTDEVEKQLGLSHIETCQRVLVNRFIDNMVSAKKCQHCKKRKHNIRQEYNRKIVLTSNNMVSKFAEEMTKCRKTLVVK